LRMMTPYKLSSTRPTTHTLGAGSCATAWRVVVELIQTTIAAAFVSVIRVVDTVRWW
jgi:hypothetical protein